MMTGRALEATTLARFASESRISVNSVNEISGSIERGWGTTQGSWEHTGVST